MIPKVSNSKPVIKKVIFHINVNQYNEIDDFLRTISINAFYKFYGKKFEVSFSILVPSDNYYGLSNFLCERLIILSFIESS